jgi:hypothetical protein
LLGSQALHNNTHLNKLFIKRPQSSLADEWVVDKNIDFATGYALLFEVEGVCSELHRYLLEFEGLLELVEEGVVWGSVVDQLDEVFESLGEDVCRNVALLVFQGLG